MNTMPRIRSAFPQDRDDFLVMWKDFVATAPDEPGNPEMGPINWERAMDPGHGLQCLVAEAEGGALLGFTLYVVLPFTWSRGDVCYLQDLFVRAEARGQGTGRAMIEELVQRARKGGWFKIFWMTQDYNQTAQKLYDRVAQRMDYVRYDLNVGQP